MRVFLVTGGGAFMVFDIEIWFFRVRHGELSRVPFWALSFLRGVRIFNHNSTCATHGLSVRILKVDKYLLRTSTKVLLVSTSTGSPSR